MQGLKGRHRYLLVSAASLVKKRNLAVVSHLLK